MAYLAVTWSEVAPVGAFVVGIIVGGIGVIRVTRYTMDYLSGQRHPSKLSGLVPRTPVERPDASARPVAADGPEIDTEGPSV